MCLSSKCLSWWPNVQACLASKIQNVCQAMLVRLAEALKTIEKHMLSINYQGITCLFNINDETKWMIGTVILTATASSFLTNRVD